MELGTMLLAITKEISAIASKVMEAHGVPAHLQPIVMECVCAQFVRAGYDYEIAKQVRAAAENEKQAKGASTGTDAQTSVEQR